MANFTQQLPFLGSNGPQRKQLRETTGSFCTDMAIGSLNISISVLPLVLQINQLQKTTCSLTALYCTSCAAGEENEPISNLWP